MGNVNRTEARDKALFAVASAGDAEGIRAALASGARVNAVFHNLTPLGVAASRGFVEALRVLIEAGAGVNFGSGALHLPLGLAARLDSEDGVACVKALLAAGADPNLAERLDTMTPLIRAAFAGNAEAGRELIKAGALMSATTQGGSNALMLSCLFNYPEFARELIEAGAEIDAVDEKGWTALMCGCNTGALESVQDLMARGASLSIRSAEGDTAVDIARKNGYADIEAAIELESALREKAELSREVKAAPSSGIWRGV